MKSKQYSDFDSLWTTNALKRFHAGRFSMMYLDEEYKMSSEPDDLIALMRMVRLQDIPSLRVMSSPRHQSSHDAPELPNPSVIIELVMDHIAKPTPSGFNVVIMGYGSDTASTSPTYDHILVFVLENETGMVHADVVPCDVYYQFERYVSYDDKRTGEEITNAIKDGHDPLQYVREYAALGSL